MPTVFRSRLRFTLRLLTAGMALSLLGCRDRLTQVEQANAANTLLIANGSEPADLDPHVITGSPESRIVLGLFEGLTRYEPTTLEPLPAVAERWELAADKITYTFFLRQNAKWSDGVPVTAHNFVAAFHRILAPEIASENAQALFYMAGAADFHEGRITDPDSIGCRAIDDHTLEITLARPTPFFVNLLSSRSWVPLPVHVLKQYDAMRRKGTRWTRIENIVGNGPFVLTEWVPNQVLTISRSPTYWDRKSVGVDHVKFLPIESETAEEAAYRAGQVHLTTAVPLSKVDIYREESPDELRISPLSGVYYYSFNTTRPPLNDPRVRQALALAIDREAIIQKVTRAGETPARHFTPDGIRGYVSTVEDMTLELDRARALLTAAGYPGGDGFPPLTLLYNTAENHRTIAEAVQQMWQRELGVDIQLENQEWRVYIDNTHNGNFDICRNGYVVAPNDPTSFLQSLTTGHGFNVSKWSNATYNKLYTASLEELDSAKRAKIFHQMEKLAFDEMPVAPIYHYTNKYLIRPEVKNWTDNMFNIFSLREVRLEP